MPDVQELIRRFHEADAAHPDRPIRVHRVAMLPTKSWRQDVHFLVVQRIQPHSRETLACRTLADIGEHLGLERVGRIIPDGAP